MNVVFDSNHTLSGAILKQMMAEEIKKVLNQSLKTTKTQRDEEYFVEEEGLRSAESSLRSQLKEESHTRTVLQVSSDWIFVFKLII